jgi:hypothetical protein
MQLRINLAPGRSKARLTTTATLLRDYDRHVATYGLGVLGALFLLWVQPDLGTFRAILFVVAVAAIAITLGLSVWQAVRRPRGSASAELLRFLHERGEAVSPEIAESIARMPDPPIGQSHSLAGTAIRVGRRLGIGRASTHT